MTKIYFYEKIAMRAAYTLFLCLLYLGLMAQDPFSHEVTTSQKPWTDRAFQNSEDWFQFAIVSDRTGGHRAGVFGDALGKLNQLHPEFVMSVGDLIEGYTKDMDILDEQWEEFDSILLHLQMRFFALPGNHDISNEVMRNLWLERYGRSYYHFKYKDVLFIAMDTNDGDGVMFSEDQINYVKEALAENEDVRWTLLFMHHPIWNFSDYNGFAEIEEALVDRPYTVFAGHTHRYFKSVRQDRNYYVLATTGGGTRLRGPRVGEFDHVTWVTMTDQGPELVHLQLSGIIDGDVLSPETAPLAMALNNAARLECISLKGDSGSDRLLLRIDNTLPESYQMESSGLFSANQQDKMNQAIGKDLLFEGRFYHNHHLNPSEHTFEVQVPANSMVEIPISIDVLGDLAPEDRDDLELDWTVRFEGPQFEPAFKLTGVKKIPMSFKPNGLEATPMDIFLNEHEISLETAFEGTEIKYTLDGSEPTMEDNTYTKPFTLDETTTVKVRLFSRDGAAASRTFSKTYRKVEPMPAVSEKGLQLEPGLKYAYYEGEFSDRIPDFKPLTQQDQGIATNSSPSLIAEKNDMRKDHFAIQFEGYIRIPEDGIYTFYTYSDDGSRLYLHDTLVVDNDGSHSARRRNGYVALQKGLVPIRVDYFEDFLGETLRVGMLGPDGEPQEIPFSDLYHHAK
jgi:hypothetical protein